MQNGEELTPASLPRREGMTFSFPRTGLARWSLVNELSRQRQSSGFQVCYESVAGRVRDHQVDFGRERGFLGSYSTGPKDWYDG